MSEPQQDLTDAALISRVRAGDESAFRDLVLRHQDRVMACCYAVTRNQADAKDAAQEAFIRLHRRLDLYDPARPLAPYLLRIAANCSRTLLSRSRRAPQTMDVLPQTQGTQPGPETELLRRERKAQVLKILEALPDTLREVMTLFYFGECSCREIAEALEMTETAVKVNLHRARRRLQDDMQELRGPA